MNLIRQDNKKLKTVLNFAERKVKFKKLFGKLENFLSFRFAKAVAL